MNKSEFMKKAMNMKAMELIKEHYGVSDDESEALAIYKEIDEEFKKVFKENKYELVHGETDTGYLYRSEYESCKDYWICEYILDTIKVEVKVSFKYLEAFESWDEEEF